MQRADALAVMQARGLDQARALYGVDEGGLEQLGAYEGCANLVYAFQAQGAARILRVSFRPDRSRAMLLSELAWIEHLARRGVRVARPLCSVQGRLIESLACSDGTLYLVAFERGVGTRVPDNGYRYRPEVPIEVYFGDWGRILGAMHRSARGYRPPQGTLPRPDWFALHQPRRLLAERVPASMTLVRRHAQATLDEVAALPRDGEGYGMMHGDLNDGNFVLDYATGAITVFDLDDCCQGWFVHELATAWEAGVGRTMFEGLEARRAFMDHYMAVLLAGYAQENSLSETWLARLPLFVKLVQLETLLHYAQYLGQPRHEAQPALAYLIRCIEDDLPWMGFFSEIYDPQHPFAVVDWR